MLLYFFFIFFIWFVDLEADEKNKNENPIAIELYNSDASSNIEFKISEWTLEEIEKYAIANNPAYLAEKQNIGMARGDIISASLWRNPTVYFQQQFIPGGSNSNNPLSLNTIVNGPVGTGGATEIAPMITQEVDVAGIINQKTKVAKQNFQAEISRFEDFDRVFRLRLRQNYWLHLYITELINFQKEFFDNYQYLLNLTKFRAEKGDISLLEYERLQLERIRIEKEYKDAEIFRAQIAKELRYLIGIAPSDQILKLKGPLKFLSTNELGVNLQDFDIEDRPDLQALKYKSIRDKLNIDLKKREGFGFYINVGGEVRIKGNDKYTGVFISAPLKLFDRNQGEIVKAEENYKKSMLEVEAKRKQIFSEIRAAQRELNEREKLLLSYRTNKLIDKNREVQEKYRLAYIRGASNLVTLLEAERNYISVLRGYYEQLYLYFNAIEVFRAAIGKLGEVNG